MSRSVCPSPPAVVFDFDGTIVDSLDVVLASYNELAPYLRILPIERESLPRLRLMSPREALREQRVALWKLPLLVHLMRRAMRSGAAQLAPCPLVVPMLQTLAASGVRCYILSTNASDNITRFLARHELHMFEQVVGGVSMFGKARALKRLLRRERLKPPSTYYVGDEVRDIAAAKAAHMKSVAVSWGYADRAALTAARPYSLAEHPDELTALLLGSR